jgi:type IV pilus assembly protein PilV
MRQRVQSARAQQGVMMIEALVAILIFTLGIVAVMGLQANSIAQMSDAKYRTDASYLAAQVMGLIWIDQGDPPGSNLTNWQSPSYTGRLGWDALVASTLPGGSGTITVTGLPPVKLVTVQIKWKQPEDVVVHSYTAVSNVTGTSSP